MAGDIFIDKEIMIKTGRDESLTYRAISKKATLEIL